MLIKPPVARPLRALQAIVCIIAVRRRVLRVNVIRNLADAVVIDVLPCLRIGRVVIVLVINDLVGGVRHPIHLHRNRLAAVVVVAHCQPSPVAVVQTTERPARTEADRVQHVGGIGRARAGDQVRAHAGERAHRIVGVIDRLVEQAGEDRAALLRDRYRGRGQRVGRSQRQSVRHILQIKECPVSNLRSGDAAAGPAASS